jgi:hypothetical protein
MNSSPLDRPEGAFAWLTRPTLAGLAALAALSLGGYLLVSAWVYRIGFPLDDAWIHQVYARNLGRHGEFAFALGQPSAGSTAPLWTGLLAVGYALRFDPFAWTFVLGALLLGTTAWLVWALARQWWPARPAVAWAAAGLTVAEWHLAWAAASGMEILLAAALVLAAFAWMGPRQSLRRGLAAGLCLGLAVATRPDSLLAAPFVLALAILPAGGARPAQPGPGRAVFGILAGLTAILAPYLLFNLQLAGTPWPNTFYAKQAEYAILRELPLGRRLWQVGLQPWIGPQALLLPGVAWVAVKGVRERIWGPVLLLGWALALALAYGLRLPVNYQYGRYVMPIIPALILAGTAGMAQLLRPGAARFWPRVLSRAALIAPAALALAFLATGSTLLARDVAIIETEMVVAARWIAGETAPGARLAAHDIGALGYFAPGRPLLDLAGLVSPEVVPFIRDEARLAAWLSEQGADYLVAFPGWYPALVSQPGVRRVFSTGAVYSPAAGGENMAVFVWPK